MNGLTLRINKCNKTTKNHVKFSVITLFPSNNDTDVVKVMKEKFNAQLNIEEQLQFVKELLNNTSNLEDTAEFLVTVFVEANPKHPIKLLLARHITDNTPIQPPFTRLLINKVSSLTFEKCTVFQDFIEVVNKVASIIENFPVGLSAMKTLDVLLIGYLKDSLNICMQRLRSDIVLTPTEKNDIFNLAHLSFRLLLNFIQKLEVNKFSNLNSVISDIKWAIEYFIVDEDVPMDTKSLCGIVYLTVHMLEKGSESWTDILTPNCSRLSTLLQNDGVKMSMYVAVFTLVSMEDLQKENISGVRAVVVLTDRILAVGERTSSESTFVLCVARAVLHISKLLEQITNPEDGLHIVEHLLLFIWGNLEHHMDNVRHLTPQALGFISKYCFKVKQEGDPNAMQILLSSLSCLDKCRKVYYVIIKLLILELGTKELMYMIPELVENLLEATGNQAVQTSATSALETLIQKYAQENNNKVHYKLILSPILNRITKDNLTSIELDILEGLLMTAFKLDPNLDNLIPFLQSSSTQFNIKCSLVVVGVIRKCVPGDLWRRYLSADVINMAATHPDHETRILSLSLIVTSPKSTEPFEQGDLDFIIYFLKYNINAQSPNFRQLVLALFKKFVKRFEDSFKAIRRQNDLKCISHNVHYYLSFLEQLRGLCFNSLLPGANYSRRVVALQVLVWTESMDLGDYSRIWTSTFVEQLLYHLEDSYESNKANTLEVLEHCPTEILRHETYSMPLDVASIIAEANSSKPTDCVSAAYKLALLIRKLPENITPELNIPTHQVCYIIVEKLLHHLTESVCCCERSLAEASQRSPMYGIVRCMRRCLEEVDVIAIRSSESWRELVRTVVQVCVRVCAAVRSVAAADSPEGALPGTSSEVTSVDGKVVTAQMVLLCAWRSVKEVSLLLGEISSRFTIATDDEEGTLSSDLLSTIDDHFTTLLTETKHRGAFEQAYVGYTMYLSRMWRASDAAAAARLRTRLDALLADISEARHSATRRSAGLPYIIQALLTTELSASGSSQLFGRVMAALLQLARSGAGVQARTHAVNILRALYRCTHLQEAVSGSVCAGLLTAMEGFHSSSWMERNASTLLFSSLMSRVFGVARARAQMSVRNKMTGRIFFLRYPQLYDYMLSKLEEMSSGTGTGGTGGTAGTDERLQPALFAALLLLARLYPSQLDGAGSHLKLAAFSAAVQRCSGGRVLGSRRLAARALQPLLPRCRYFKHVESTLTLLCDYNIRRNYCHGLLLQLTTLLEGKPEGLSVDDELSERIACVLLNTIWILEQTLARAPCYMIADEYIRMINLIVWKYPKMIKSETLCQVQLILQKLLFENRIETQVATSGMEVYLTNAIYLQIILAIYTKHDITELLIKALQHASYDVQLPAMNYLLLQQQEIETEPCLFLQHLQTYTQNGQNHSLDKIQPQLLIKIYENTKHLESQVKCLKLLTIQKNNQGRIVALITKQNSEDLNVIVSTLIDCIQHENENLTHIYLKNLIDLSDQDNIYTGIYFDILREAFSCSRSENSDDTRKEVVSFLEHKLNTLFNIWSFSEDMETQFEIKATLLATIIILLEDDDSNIRDRAAVLAIRYVNLSTNINNPCILQGAVMSSKAGEELRRVVAEGTEESVAKLVMIALLDFKSEVRLNDDVTDEYRVFDQSERYNINLEETVWTSACADLISRILGYNVITSIKNILQNEIYRNVLHKLCDDNLTLFENMLFGGKEILNNDLVNPKFKLFANKIQSKNIEQSIEGASK